MDAQHAWQKALEQLEQEISRFWYDRLVRETRLLSYQEGRFEISVPTADARDWLEDRLTGTIRHLLEDVLNRPVEVLFAVRSFQEEDLVIPQEDTQVIEVKRDQLEVKRGIDFEVILAEEPVDGRENALVGEEKAIVQIDPKTRKLNGWTPLFDDLIERYGVVIAAVGGKIWRYSQMRDHVCRAAVATLARELNISSKTIQRAIHILVDDGFIVDLTPNLRHRPHVYVTRNQQGIQRFKENASHQTFKKIKTVESLKKPREPFFLSHELQDRNSVTLMDTGESVWPSHVPDGPNHLPLDRSNGTQSHTDGLSETINGTFRLTSLSSNPFSVTQSPSQCDSESISV